MRIHAVTLLFSLSLACGSAPEGEAPESEDASPEVALEETGDEAGDDTATSPTDTGAEDAVPESSAGADVETGMTDDDAPFADKRASCTFKGGAKPSETFGPSIVAMKIPIDTIVIVSQENRSFDSYFSKLPEAGVTDVDVAKADATNPDPSGKPVSRFHSSDYCFEDTKHGWDSMHTFYDGGKNDGFARGNATTADPTGKRAMGYFDESDLPFYYALAKTYGIGDRYFAPMLSQTGPNRLYLYGASSYGHVTNGPGLAPGAPNIFKRLSDAKVSFKVYSAATSTPRYSFETSIVGGSIPDGAFSYAEFQADAAAGKLPHVVFVYAGSDEHPSADMQKGQHDVWKWFSTFASSPQWAKGAFMLTYDESGGQYDHVPPPPACEPDAYDPIVPGEASAPGKFDRYGFRVPFLLASPYAKPHFVSHTVNSHTSILRFLELRFDLPAMTARDANANPLLEFFDFSKASFATPTIPPEPPIADPKSKGC